MEVTDIWMLIVITLFDIMNGSPKEFFAATRGLWQGVPLSAFLFTLVADSFPLIINKGVSKWLIKGFSVDSQKVIVSHLQYADATLILIDNSTSGLRNVMMMIQCFELAMDSGLKLVRGKEIVGTGNWPIRNLKLWPLFWAANPLIFPLNIWASHLEAILDGNLFGNQFYKDAGKDWPFESQIIYLSRRITLIKAALNNLTIYFFSIFKIPKGVATEMKQPQKHFLWKGREQFKPHLIPWCQQKFSFIGQMALEAP